MRMSDAEYFRSCVAKERHLAHLLGHDHVEEFYESAGTLWENSKPLPKWTRDWKACGALLAQYELPLTFHKEPGASHSSAVRIGPIEVQFADHPSKERAIMYAIVKAVIFQLEHHLHSKH